MKNRDIITTDMVGKPHTIVTVELKNGFTITEVSTCVDPANFSEEIGVEICMKKIEDKIWMLEGYLLQESLFNKQ